MVDITLREIAPTIGASLDNHVRVTFVITREVGITFDLTFVVPMTKGLDTAVSDAKALLEAFADDLVTAAKGYSFP
jgi:hypothetical protein